MRILMVVPKFPFPVVGGLERQAHELAKSLVQRGHTVHALSSRFESGQNDVGLLDGILVHRVAWVESRALRFLLSPFSLVRILYKLKRNADVVHVHNISWFGTFVALFAKVWGLPVITKLPSMDGIGVVRGCPFGILRIALLKRSDAIIAMTPESVAELANIDYSSTRIFKVTNGISLQPDPAIMSSSSSDAVRVVFVGRLLPQKGLLDLLHAWAAVKARATRPVMLRLIGDGPQRDELRALALTLGLGETVEFVGYSGDVPAELAKADLFVLPSYGEGNSNAILEAMRAGLPIISTRVGGTPIQVGSEGERFLVSPGDRKALAERLLELIEEKALRVHLGSAMRERIESLFSIDRIASIYEKAYELILSGHREQIGQLNSGLFKRDEKGRINRSTPGTEAENLQHGITWVSGKNSS